VAVPCSVHERRGPLSLGERSAKGSDRVVLVVAEFAHDPPPVVPVDKGEIFPLPKEGLLLGEGEGEELSLLDCLSGAPSMLAPLPCPCLLFSFSHLAFAPRFPRSTACFFRSWAASISRSILRWRHSPSW